MVNRSKKYKCDSSLSTFRCLAQTVLVVVILVVSYINNTAWALTWDMDAGWAAPNGTFPTGDPVSTCQLFMDFQEEHAIPSGSRTYQLLYLSKVNGQEYPRAWNCVMGYQCYGFLGCDVGRTYYWDEVISSDGICEDGETLNPLGLCEGEIPEIGLPRCNAQASHPINVSTGNKYLEEADYQSTGPSPITFKRFYNSKTTNDAVGLGANWRSNQHRILSLAPGLGNSVTQTPYCTEIISSGVDGTGMCYSVVNFTRSDGMHIRSYATHLVSLRNLGYDGATFSPPGTVWHLSSYGGGTLLKLEGGYQLVTPNNETDIYSELGQLISSTDANGNTQAYSYDVDGRLSRIENSAGDYLNFSYDSQGRIASFADRSGRVWKYQYDANGNLEFVIYPDATPSDDTDNPRRQYHYNEPAYTSGTDLPHALTGVTDERGVRYATYEYNANGDAIASYLADNVDRVDIQYFEDGSRTLTNSRGVTSTYTTAKQSGVTLVTGIDGPGCSTCSDGDTAFEYDAANNLTAKVEQGVRTEYGAFDDNGQYTYEIEAVGSPQERRIDYSYDSRFFDKIATITEPSVYASGQKITTYTYDDFGNRLSETVDGFTPDGTPITRTTSYVYAGPLNQISQIDGPRIDVADITQVPVGTVRSRLSRARKTLRTALHGALADGPGSENRSSETESNNTQQNVIQLRRTSP